MGKCAQKALGVRGHLSNDAQKKLLFLKRRTSKLKLARCVSVCGPLSLMFYQIGKDTLLGTEIYRSPGISKIVAE